MQKKHNSKKHHLQNEIQSEWQINIVVPATGITILHDSYYYLLSQLIHPTYAINI